MQDLKVSLVIPVRDEAESVEALVASIRRQTLPPDEVVFVDGGSNDRTVPILEALGHEYPAITLVKTDGATPGRGRNLGIDAARNEWIALTDAGIRLDRDWLEQLAAAAADADIVFGNYAPVVESFFERSAAFSYVPAQRGASIRSRFVASSLMRKQVWKDAGGFPDLRAAEDLMFIEKVEAGGAKIGFAPTAMVDWQLRPDIASTFRKFVLYSKHNVFAGRQWDWHYGVLRQYAFLLPVLVLAAVHSSWWLVLLPAWLLGRTAKRMLAYREEAGWAAIFNPLSIAFTAFLILLIDAATFIGWIQAAISRRNSNAHGS